MSSDMSTVFAGFVEAAKALEEKPALLREVELHKSARDQALSAMDQMKEDIAAKAKAIADLQARISDLEASLDVASKSQKETGSKLEVILSAVKGIMGEVNAAVSLVEPESNPTVPSAATSETAPTASAESTASALPSDGPQHVEDYSHPTVPSTDTQSPGASATVGQGPAEGSDGVSSGQSEENPQKSTALGSGGEGQSEANPTVSSTDGTSGIAPQGDTPTPVGSPVQQSADASQPSQHGIGTTIEHVAEDTRPVPHSKPYWTKPTDVSWENWVHNGGESAPWINVKG